MCSFFSLIEGAAPTPPPTRLFFPKLFSPPTGLCILKSQRQVRACKCLLSLLLHSAVLFPRESSPHLSCKHFRLSSSMSQVTESKQVSELCLEILVSSLRLAKPWVFPSKHRYLVIPSQSPHGDCPLLISYWAPYYF